MVLQQFCKLPTGVRFPQWAPIPFGIMAERHPYKVKAKVRFLQWGPILQSISPTAEATRLERV